jgi:hypothetical protein
MGLAPGDAGTGGDEQSNQATNNSRDLLHKGYQPLSQD